MNLGGVSGPAGGFGAPPGGFIGQLPQTRVSYDEDELASLSTPASGMSLLDNLNHIRYRLDLVESGSSITVIDDNNLLAYADVDTIHFSGIALVVNDLGSGDIQIVVTATGSGGGGVPEAPNDGITYGRKSSAWSSLDAEYLRLDTTNSPLINQLLIINPNNAAGGIYVQTIGDAFTADVEQYTVDDQVNNPTLFLYRETSGTGDIVSPMLEMWQDSTGTGEITGGFIHIIDVATGKFFDVDVNGAPNIPSGQFYNINGIPHTHDLIGSGIIVEEFDGNPSVAGVEKIIFSGAVVIDNFDNSVTVVISGGAGGNVVNPSVEDNFVSFNDAVGTLKDSGVSEMDFPRLFFIQAVPTMNDDFNDGYKEGDIWIIPSSGTIYICTDNTPMYAIWKRISFPSAENPNDMIFADSTGFWLPKSIENTVVTIRGTTGSPGFGGGLDAIYDARYAAIADAFTNEKAQDAIAAAFAAGTQTGLTITYDDVNNKFDITVTSTGDGNPARAWIGL